MKTALQTSPASSRLCQPMRMFAMAASVVAGKPIGLGDPEKLTALSPGAPHMTAG